jgi:hypothetical protein
VKNYSISVPTSIIVKANSKRQALQILKAKFKTKVIPVTGAAFPHKTMGYWTEDARIGEGMTDGELQLASETPGMGITVKTKN